MTLSTSSPCSVIGLFEEPTTKTKRKFDSIGGKYWGEENKKRQAMAATDDEFEDSFLEYEKTSMTIDSVKQEEDSNIKESYNQTKGFSNGPDEQEKQIEKTIVTSGIDRDFDVVQGLPTSADLNEKDGKFEDSYLEYEETSITVDSIEQEEDPDTMDELSETSSEKWDTQSDALEDENLYFPELSKRIDWIRRNVFGGWQDDVMSDGTEEMQRKQKARSALDTLDAFASGIIERHEYDSECSGFEYLEDELREFDLPWPFFDSVEPEVYVEVDEDWGYGEEAEEEIWETSSEEDVLQWVLEEISRNPELLDQMRRRIDRIRRKLFGGLQDDVVWDGTEEMRRKLKARSALDRFEAYVSGTIERHEYDSQCSGCEYLADELCECDAVWEEGFDEVKISWELDEEPDLHMGS